MSSRFTPNGNLLRRIRRPGFSGIFTTRDAQATLRENEARASRKVRRRIGNGVS